MVDQIAAKVRAGGRVTADEALALYRHAPTPILGRLADAVRSRKHPAGIVTYIIDRNVNYTNVCVARCNFCAFYREVGHGEGYVLAFDETARRNPDAVVDVIRGAFRTGMRDFTFNLDSNDFIRITGYLDPNAAAAAMSSGGGSSGGGGSGGSSASSGSNPATTVTTTNSALSENANQRRLGAGVMGKGT